MNPSSPLALAPDTGFAEAATELPPEALVRLSDNRDRLAASLAWLRGALERHAAKAGQGDQTPSDPDGGKRPPDAPILAALGRRFALSSFERDVLLLAAGVELEAGFGALCAAAQGGTRPWPSFSLAFAALPDAHWSALAPESALRRFQLIRVDEGPVLTQARLSVDERILHLLLGLSNRDPWLAALLYPPTAPMALPVSQRRLAHRLAQYWHDDATALVRLTGSDRESAPELAAMAAGELGWQLLELHAGDLPSPPTERHPLGALLERECRLGPAALLLVTEPGMTLAPAWLEQLNLPLAVLGELPSGLRRAARTLELAKPLAEEQRALWNSAWPELETLPPAQLTRLTAQFELGTRSLHAAADSARRLRESGLTTEAALWQACREQVRGGLDGLAQRIEPRATWDDLVLPSPARDGLKELAMQLRHRGTVYQSWGFAGKSARGLGLSALFVGESGTGKTMAAEILAGELKLDLYRIDLSAVVSKYIGETEKNLSRVFDAAEASGAVLLFDEADALFGKRSEVRDSHDRYANIELAYLLQRMEAYRGLAILTTNLKGMLDVAFLRRIRFLIHFPFPDAASRAAIWQRSLPEALPRGELDFKRLAQLNIAGGGIRNIALNAAFLAAEDDRPLAMSHLLHAARREYAKLEKPLSEAECGGWA